jgi:hypothetical protein
MTKISFAFLIAGLSASGSARAEQVIVCTLNPMVFDDKGEAQVLLDGASEELKMNERQSLDGKTTYLKGETVLTQTVGGVSYKVYVTATIEHKNPDLLRVVSRIQRDVIGREGGTFASVLMGPAEQTAWFSRPPEFPEMPLVAATLTAFANSSLYEQFLNSKGRMNMSTTDLMNQLLEDASKNPAQYRNKLYSLDLQCMGRQ